MAMLNNQRVIVTNLPLIVNICKNGNLFAMGSMRCGPKKSPADPRKTRLSRKQWFPPMKERNIK